MSIPAGSIYPGITAGEARAAGEDVAGHVPDAAILVVDAIEVVDGSERADGTLVVAYRMVGARWVWDADGLSN